MNPHLAALARMHSDAKSLVRQLAGPEDPGPKIRIGEMTAAPELPVTGYERIVVRSNLTEAAAHERNPIRRPHAGG